MIIFLDLKLRIETTKNFKRKKKSVNIKTTTIAEVIAFT
jgi:hypothetical protein